MIAVPKTIFCEQRQSFSTGTLEALTVDVTLQSSHKFSISTLYRPPTVKLDNLLQFLNFYLVNIPQNTPAVIVGDFNDNLNQNKDSKLVNYMKGHTKNSDTYNKSR